MFDSKTLLRVEVIILSHLYCSAACGVSCGLAKLLARDANNSETPTLFWKGFIICLDKNLNGFPACVYLDANGRLAKVNLMAATVLSSDNGMRHLYVAPVPIAKSVIGQEC
jgi:hypothetical protein